jgi:hypothetical protein
MFTSSQSFGLLLEVERPDGRFSVSSVPLHLLPVPPQLTAAVSVNVLPVSYADPSLGAVIDGVPIVAA